DPLGAGLQNVQAQISIGSGGIFGRGLGQGIEKIHYLPEAHTDMIFAVISEELGLIGAAVLVAGYCAFAYAGLRLAIACKDPFGKRLAAGITALVCGQAAINLAAVLGLAPLTGIPLPFVSYGGSSLVITLLGVGILLNIARGHARTTRASVPDRGRGDGRTSRPVARSGGSAARARRRGSFLRTGTRSTRSPSPGSPAAPVPRSCARSRSRRPRRSPASGSSSGGGRTSSSAAAATSPGRWCSPHGCAAFPRR
ncbi:MAG: FtsW/RodA/SpoVE family cell cycle protein, partial [Actinobacteria bacterium]